MHLQKSSTNLFSPRAGEEEARLPGPGYGLSHSFPSCAGLSKGGRFHWLLNWSPLAVSPHFLHCGPPKTCFGEYWDVIGVCYWAAKVNCNRPELSAGQGPQQAYVLFPFEQRRDSSRFLLSLGGRIPGLFTDNETEDWQVTLVGNTLSFTAPHAHPQGSAVESGYISEKWLGVPNT